MVGLCFLKCEFDEGFWVEGCWYFVWVLNLFFWFEGLRILLEV